MQISKRIILVVTLVVSLVLLPVVYSIIDNLTETKTEEVDVTFEVLTYDEETYEGAITPNTFINILNYAIIEDNSINNIVSIKVNEIEADSLSFYIPNELDYIVLSWNSLEGEYNLELYDDNNFMNDGSTIVPEVDDEWVITFELTIPPVVSPTLATLLYLLPLIMVAGIVSLAVMEMFKQNI